jgi:hypothetical protein
MLPPAFFGAWHSCFNDIKKCYLEEWSIKTKASALAIFPAPSVGDEDVQIGELGLPAQNALGQSRVCHQPGRITPAPGLVHQRQGPTRHPFHRVNHLLHRKPPPVAQVELLAASAAHQRLQSQPVRSTQILHMHIVAHASAIGRVVIAPKHLQVRPAPCGYLQSQRNQIGHYASKDYPEHLRRIKFKDPQTGKVLVFLTNNMTLPALTITALYKNRWQVELFFKWIKQHLRIKKFLGTSENAVKTQIWCAVATYVLIAIVKKELQLKASLYTFLQILSVSVFEKTSISCALQTDAYTTEPPDCAKQLNLFTF